MNSQTESDKPIIAKDNFVLAHKNLIPSVMNLIKMQRKSQ